MDELDFGDLGPIGSLTDTTRRRLYEYVLASNEAVGRDEAADALALPRQTVAYHLDRLADDGLVDVEFIRRSGRSGPGAGRPAKLYRKTGRDYEVTVPPRRYGLAARILLEAVAAGAVKRAQLMTVARRIGEEIGADGLELALAGTGYDPVIEDGEVRFRNCPFHMLKEQDRKTVCSLNLGLVEGMICGAGDDADAYLQPSDIYCCVRIRTGA